MSSKSKSSKKSSKGKKGKKSKLDETRQNAIKEKPYVTREVETSITLLESPEDALVLEALLFLSKYGDVQANNVDFLQSHGLLPKLLALFDHNICILRVSLRLLSELLATGATQTEINQEKFAPQIQKIVRLYMDHKDEQVKEFAGLILAVYCKFGRLEILLAEPNLIKAILKTIKSPENDIILNSSLELFGKFIELQSVRMSLSAEENFNLDTFIQQMTKSDDCFNTILNIFEKMTYFGEDELQLRLKECRLVEHVINIIIDPNKKQHQLKGLKIVLHSMGNENTNSYFVESLEFLKFCQWVKSCPDDTMLLSAQIFMELSKIEHIKQLLFDLSVEDSILSFLRSDNKSVLNATCEAISNMSRHKYCCEKMLTPIVVKKLLEILRRTKDSEDPQNETALTTLHYLCRRDSRTIHMLSEYKGVDVLLKYLKAGTERLSRPCYTRLLEIINMFVTNNQLKHVVLTPDLYATMMFQITSRFDDIKIRSLEILVNCLNQEEFREYFVANNGPQIIVDHLATGRNEKVIRILSIFVLNGMMFEKVAHSLIYCRLLLVLKKIPEAIKYRNPLIDRNINLIYNMCLPVKFHETGRLDLMDKLGGRFYIIKGRWHGPFPFLEILILRQTSTISTIYVVEFPKDEVGGDNSGAINYGKLSPDPFLRDYVRKIKQLLERVDSLAAKIKILAEFIDSLMCGPSESATHPDKLHTFNLHIACLKCKLGTNLIPIGYLRLGFHCERALLFKALADQAHIPATLVRASNNLYWNEVALLSPASNKTALKVFVVDLMVTVGKLMPVGSRECNAYCDIQ